MTKALYRKYRSKSLSEVVGQDHVTDILVRQVKSGRVAHAYLLTGPRGVGKTSIARILAHEINQLPYSDDATHLDIIEIDAASNNGVEDVRDLREKVMVAPVSASKKIYIIDEVHMLSKAAFNALLKTLEEPPEHVVFILATTDVDKLPPTIISRTQRFGFRAIAAEDAVKHLRHISDQEKIAISDEALELIALRGDGSFRDSISLLDQLSSLAEPKQSISAEMVEQSLGLAPATMVTELLEAYLAKDLKAIVRSLDTAEQNGLQPTVLVSQLVQAIRPQLTEKPQLMLLLDQLLDVTKSSRPSLKLLTVLAGDATIRPRTAALSAPTPSISAPIAELEKQAVRARPKLTPPVKNIETAAVATKPQPTPKKKAGKLPTTIDWDGLVEYTRARYVAIYSVLSKCSYELQDGVVTIYTGSAFYKKKLDDVKYRPLLAECLQEVTGSELTIETVGSPAPPKDSVAAAVAAIMGGGEEVTV